MRYNQTVLFPSAEAEVEDYPITRRWHMASKNTFSIKPIAELIQEEVGEGLWIDAFANESKAAVITNDLNPSMPTDYHLEANEFFKLFADGSVDGVFYDPPYSPRQVKECYEGFGMNVTQEDTQIKFYSDHKNEIARVLKTGGKCLSFGWNSNGIGKTRGFKIKRILIVAHGGAKNDTIVTVEEKVA